MQHQAKKTVTSRGFFDWLTLEVVSAADSPRPTRLHLEPKAERELAWAAMGCLPTAAISLRFSFDGTRGCGSGQWRRRFPGSFFILTPSRSPTWGEDGGGRSPRHPEEGGSFSGGSDMKGSSGPGEWTSPQQQQHTDVCQWWDLWRFLSRILIAFFCLEWWKVLRVEEEDVGRRFSGLASIKRGGKSSIVNVISRDKCRFVS